MSIEDRLEMQSSNDFTTSNSNVDDLNNRHGYESSQVIPGYNNFGVRGEDIHSYLVSHGSGSSPPKEPRTNRINEHSGRMETDGGEELQHDSELSASLEAAGIINSLHSRPIDGGGTTSIQVQDIGYEDSVNFTTSTLRKCKELVLRPYWGLLVFIGWRGWGKESIHSYRNRWRVVNIIYPLLIILLLLYTYMYEVLTCEWKLDIYTEPQTTDILELVKDVAKAINDADIRHHEPRMTTTTPTTTKTTNISMMLLSPASTNNNASWAPLVDGHNVGCDHIITTYIIPNILHFVAYIMGLYYFRVQENEQLYALMEKVFLQATSVQARAASQQKMIRKLRIFLAVGSVWVLLTVSLQVVYVMAFHFPTMPLFEKTGRLGYWLLLSFELVGRIVFNCVIFAIVMNYITQCEMIKFYVKGLAMRLQEKSTELRIAMKDVLMIRQSLSALNGPISKMTSLASFILIELTIIGFVVLFINHDHTPYVAVYRGCFPFVWGAMCALPLVQAARVNSVCLRIRKIAIEMRVFGYKGASILDLDSFLQFVSITKLKGKLFHITIVPSHLIFTFIVSTFALILLFQTNVIHSKHKIL